jgi:uncharacterized protein involved in exopolysaccharide biosynthesis
MAVEIELTDLGERVELPSAPRDGEAAAIERKEISFLDLLIVLARRKRAISWITGSFTVLALLAAFILPRRFTATVTLLPPQQSSSMGAVIASQLGNISGMAALAGNGLNIKNPNDMYVAMLRSRTVENAMVQHFGLMQEYRARYLDDARKAFEKRTAVDGSGKDGFIHLSVEDHDPRRAADLANGYVDQFRALSEHLAITEASQRRLFFEQQLEQAKDNLANAEEAMKGTEQTTGLIQLDSQARALIESAASLRAQIAAQEVQIQGMKTYATGENAQVVQAQQELDTMRAQLAKLGGSADSGNGGLLVPKGAVPEASLEYGRKLRDVKYYETIFDILARQFEIAKLDEAKQGALIQVVDPATPPEKRSFPKFSIFLIGGFIVGLLTAVCFALASEAIDSLNSSPATSAKLTYLKSLLFRQAHSAPR